METLNAVAAVATIISLIISVLVYNKVQKIDNSISSKTVKRKHQKTDITGDGNVVSGRNTHIKK